MKGGNNMGNLLSAIYDFITIVCIGGAILLFAGEVQLEVQKNLLTVVPN